MTPPALLEELQRWRSAGWLRSLDLALVRFIHELDADAPPSLLLAAALVAQLEGRGHSGLPLHELQAEPDALLGWPPEGLQALRLGMAGCGLDQADVQTAWQTTPVLEVDPADDSGATPLVCSGGLLYLRRYWRYECRVAAQVRLRSTADSTLNSTTAPPDPAAVAAQLDQLFGAVDAGADTNWQRRACEVALRSRFSIVTGGPGTGKTYTAARLLVLLQSLHAGPQPLRVALAAPTGKAAARLRQSIQKALQGLREQAGTHLNLGAWVDQLDAARTLHALLGTQNGTRRFRHDAANPLEVDVLFVDEASMVHLEMMAQLLEALPVTARVVLLGDKDQLSSVEAGAVLGDLCQSPALAAHTVVLRKSHRFDGPIGQLALAVNAGDTAAAWAHLKVDSNGPVQWWPAAEPAALLNLAVQGRDPGGAAAVGYRAYLERVAQRPAQADAFETWSRDVLRQFDRFRVLAAVREGPWGVTGLNSAIERALADAGLLQRRGEWYEGRPVIVTRNEPALGVFNGDVGVVLRSPGAEGGLRACFLDGDSLRAVSVGRLADVETAFAMTVHKSQGSEFEHVLLVLPEEDNPVLTRELVYTGITRASQAFTLACKQPQVLAQSVGRLTRRVSGLKARLG
jgi:exodeoxyribonuclease V alpha subunit